MRKRGVIVGLLFLLGWIGAGIGCSVPTGNQHSSARNLLRYAQRFKKTNPQQAIQILEKCLQVDPSLVEVHMELASLYMDPSLTNVFDPIFAMYHLKKYAQAVQDRSERITVSNFIHQCQLLIQQSILSQSIQENQRLRKMNEELRRRNQELLAQIRQLKAAYQLNASSLTVSSQNLSARSGGGPSFVSYSSSDRGTIRPSQAKRVHIVKRGECLSSIARRYNVPLQALIQANRGINPDRIFPGQRIIIP